MVIKVDKEGQKFLTELADLVLKGAGIAGLKQVNQMGQILTLIEDELDNKTPNMEITKSGEVTDVKGRPEDEVKGKG